MATEQDMLNRLQSQYGDMGTGNNTIEDTIRIATSPGAKQLIEEGNAMRDKSQTSMYDSLNSMGTTARDMNPLEQLSSSIQGANTAMNPYRTNLGLRDFYKADVNSLIDKGQKQYQNNYQNLKDLYAMKHGNAIDWANVRNAATSAGSAYAGINENRRQFNILQGVDNAGNITGGGRSKIRVVQ
jgi:hypothetical protein